MSSHMLRAARAVLTDTGASLRGSVLEGLRACSAAHTAFPSTRSFATDQPAATDEAPKVPTKASEVKTSFAASVAQVTRADPQNALSIFPDIVGIVLDCIPAAVHSVAVTSISETALRAAASEEAAAENREGAMPMMDVVFSVDPRHILETMRFLATHANLQFNTLVDMTCVDYPERRARFEVTYVLYSPTLNARVIVKCMNDEITPIESVTSVFLNANWLERETWDMFGVFFKNHPDLRRLLTDYGFTHFPLRKDFPVQGYTEVFYSEERKAVTTRSVQLAQTQRVVSGN